MYIYMMRFPIMTPSLALVTIAVLMYTQIDTAESAVPVFFNTLADNPVTFRLIMTLKSYLTYMTDLAIDAYTKNTAYLDGKGITTYQPKTGNEYCTAFTASMTEADLQSDLCSFYCAISSHIYIEFAEAAANVELNCTEIQNDSTGCELRERLQGAIGNVLRELVHYEVTPANGTTPATCDVPCVASSIDYDIVAGVDQILEPLLQTSVCIGYKLWGAKLSGLQRNNGTFSIRQLIRPIGDTTSQA